MECSYLPLSLGLSVYLVVYQIGHEFKFSPDQGKSMCKEMPLSLIFTAFQIALVLKSSFPGVN